VKPVGASPRVFAVEWLKLREPDEPVSLDQAITPGKIGGDRRSEQAKADQADNISLKYGTSRAYILARLEREREGWACRNDLTADELAAVAATVRRAVEEDKYPRAPRLDPLRAALAKLDPAPPPSPTPHASKVDKRARR
jgi:hypothetical protein